MWRSWDDEHLVFNPASGETHLLDSIAAAVIREAESSRMETERCCLVLERQLCERNGEEFEQLASSLLNQLDELGLLVEVSQ